jgi:hypothetical protein
MLLDGWSNVYRPFIFLLPKQEFPGLLVGDIGGNRPLKRYTGFPGVEDIKREL